MLHKQLFTIDSKDRLRVWQMESQDNKYRTISGLVDGEKVTSSWKKATGKNIGKSNETSPDQQALLEVAAVYTKKIDNKYYENLEDAAGKKYFEVMLAEKFKDPKRRREVDAALASGQGIFCQPKLDGMRMTLSRHDDGVNRGISRNGKQFFTVQHIINELQPLFSKNPDLILDGELYNHELHDDFNSISSLIRQEKPTAEDIAAAEKMVQYHVYDLPSCSGNFDERNAILRSLISDNRDDIRKPKFQSVRYVRTDFFMSQEDIDEAYAQYISDGYEGQMIRFNKPYDHGRSNWLLKRKEFVDAEYKIIRVEQGTGNWEGYAKVVLFEVPGYIPEDEDDIPKAGIKGNQAFTKKLLSDWKQYEYVTIRSPNLTPGGKPRFGVAADWHKGKRND